MKLLSTFTLTLSAHERSAGAGGPQQWENKERELPARIMGIRKLARQRGLQLIFAIQYNNCNRR